MAMIKSALELALEKTKDMKVDPAALEASETKQDGKRTAGQYLEDPDSVDIEKKLAACPKDKRIHLKAGMHEILSSQLQLPTGEAGLEKLDKIAAAYVALSAGAGLLGGAVGGAIAEKKIQGLFQQLAAFLKQYLDDMKNVEQVIKKQWAPKLREKERQMAARLGQDVRLDPMMDPEFSAFYKQNVGALRQQYQAALDKAKQDLGGMIGLPQD